MVFERWQDVIALGKCADAVLIGLQVRACSCSVSLTVALILQDSLHAEAVTAFSQQGYHIMCEKPMATSVGDCVRMLRDVTSAPMSGKVFAIGHVMRYSPYNVAVREVIDSGVLGDIVDVQVSTASMPRTQILTNSTQSRSGTSTLLTRLFGEVGARRRRARLPSCPNAAST